MFHRSDCYVTGTEANNPRLFMPYYKCSSTDKIKKRVLLQQCQQLSFTQHCDPSVDHRDFRALALIAPSMISLADNLTVTIEYEVSLATEAIPIRALDFRCSLFLTHGPMDDPSTGHQLSELFSDAG